MVLCVRMGLVLRGRKSVYMWVGWPVHGGQNDLAVWEIIQTIAAFKQWQPVLQCLVEMVENTCVDHTIISTKLVTVQRRFLSKKAAKCAVGCCKLVPSSIELVQRAGNRLSEIVPESTDAVKTVGLGGDYV